MIRQAPTSHHHAPRIVGLLLLAGLLLFAREARAQWDWSIGSFELLGQEISLELTDTFKYTYHIKDELGAHSDSVTLNGETKKVQRLKHQVFNTLDFALGSGPFRLGARLDLNLFAGLASEEYCPGAAWCNQEDDERRYQDNFSLERIFLSVSEEAFDVTLGDFYACLGKGMALSAVKLSELGQDNAIRGGKFVLHHGPVEFTVLGGTFNFLDIDESEGWSAPWDSEPVVAGRLQVQIMDRVGLGAHGVLILRQCGELCDDRSDSEIRVDRDLVGGVTVDVPDLLDGMLSFYGEVDLQQTIKDDGVYVGVAGEQGDGSEPEFKGIGAYAAATASLGDINVLVEYKYYNGFFLAAPQGRDESYVPRYHQPPTLEWIRAEISNPTSVTGVHVQADYSFGELGPVELSAEIHYGYFENWDNDDGAHNVHNPYATLELEYLDGDGGLDLTGGVRREVNTELDHIYQQEVFFEFNIEQLLADSHSVKLSTVVLLRTKVDSVDFLDPSKVTLKDWNEVELTLDYRFSPWMSLTFSYERNSSQDDRPNYFGGGGRFYVNSGTYLEVWGGQNKPGIKCRNGNCRFYPAFSGVKFILVGRI